MNGDSDWHPEESQRGFWFCPVSFFFSFFFLEFRRSSSIRATFCFLSFLLQFFFFSKENNLAQHSALPGIKFRPQPTIRWLMKLLFRHRRHSLLSEGSDPWDVCSGLYQCGAIYCSPSANEKLSRILGTSGGKKTENKAKRMRPGVLQCFTSVLTGR